ncbi:hypothetical protein ACHAWF_011134 [Thalassiosira exigua]
MGSSVGARLVISPWGSAELTGAVEAPVSALACDYEPILSPTPWIPVDPGDALGHLRNRREYVERYILISRDDDGSYLPSKLYTFDRFLSFLRTMAVNGLEPTSASTSSRAIQTSAFLANATVESIDGDKSDQWNWQDTSGHGYAHRSGYWNENAGAVVESGGYSNDLGRTNTKGCCWWGQGALMTVSVRRFLRESRCDMRERPLGRAAMDGGDVRVVGADPAIRPRRVELRRAAEGVLRQRHGRRSIHQFRSPNPRAGVPRARLLGVRGSRSGQATVQLLLDPSRNHRRGEAFESAGSDEPPDGAADGFSVDGATQHKLRPTRRPTPRLTVAAATPGPTDASAPCAL